MPALVRTTLVVLLGIAAAVAGCSEGRPAGRIDGSRADARPTDVAGHVDDGFDADGPTIGMWSGPSALDWLTISCGCTPVASLERVKEFATATTTRSMSPCYRPLIGCSYGPPDGTATDACPEPAPFLPGSALQVRDDDGRTARTRIALPWIPATGFDEARVEVRSIGWLGTTNGATPQLSAVALKEVPETPSTLDAQWWSAADAIGQGKSVVWSDAVGTFGRALPSARVDSDVLVSMAWSRLIISRGDAVRRKLALIVEVPSLGDDSALNVSVHLDGLDPVSSTWRLQGPLKAPILLGVLAIGACRQEPRFIVCARDPTTGNARWQTHLPLPDEACSL